MPQAIRRVLVATVLAGGLFSEHASAQGLSYIPLDHAELPLLEHFIARGEDRGPLAPGLAVPPG